MGDTRLEIVRPGIISEGPSPISGMQHDDRSTVPAKASFEERMYEAVLARELTIGQAARAVEEAKLLAMAQKLAA